MAGDVNLFIDSDGRPAAPPIGSGECRLLRLLHESGHGCSADVRSAELDVMIAEESSRRKGLGREAVLLMIAYGAKQHSKSTECTAVDVELGSRELSVVFVGEQHLGLSRFVVKIGFANKPSQQLFLSLGYPHPRPPSSHLFKFSQP